MKLLCSKDNKFRHETNLTIKYVVQVFIRKLINNFQLPPRREYFITCCMLKLPSVEHTVEACAYLGYLLLQFLTQ